MGDKLLHISSHKNDEFCENAMPYSDGEDETEVSCLSNKKCSYQRTARNRNGDVVIMCDQY